MKKVIIALSLLMGFIACGPSKAELEAKEKAKMDSVAAATTKAIADEQAAQAATEAEAQNQESLKQQLIELKSQLAAIATEAPPSIIKDKVYFEKQITKNRLTGSPIFIKIHKNEFLEPTSKT